MNDMVHLFWPYIFGLFVACGTVCMAIGLFVLWDWYGDRVTGFFRYSLPWFIALAYTGCMWHISGKQRRIWIDYGVETMCRWFEGMNKYNQDPKMMDAYKRIRKVMEQYHSANEED